MEELDLRGRDARITDASLEHLAGLANLKKLWLPRGRFSAQALVNLRQLLPECEIDVG